MPLTKVTLCTSFKWVIIMLDILLTTLQPSSTYDGGDYPNSGPGPTTLKVGDTELGYFGRVASSALMSYVALRTHLTTTAWQTNTDMGWLKFMFKGKVLFIAQTWCYHNVSWQDVYKAGAIYGVNGPGAYPAPAGTPINQYKPVTIQADDKQWTLVPRMMQVAASDPYIRTATVEGSELSELIGRCTVYEAFPGAGLFDNLTREEIGLNRVHNGLTTLTPTTTQCILAGYPAGNVWDTFLSIAKTDARGYVQVFRAVLEVEGDPTVLPTIETP